MPQEVRCPAAITARHPDGVPERVRHVLVSERIEIVREDDARNQRGLRGEFRLDLRLPRHDDLNGFRFV